MPAEAWYHKRKVKIPKITYGVSGISLYTLLLREE